MDRVLGTVLWPDLHRLRHVRARRHPWCPGEPAGAAAGASLMALLELHGLTKRYGGLLAVNNVSFRVEPGEVRAVIGPNGAGKTSLFHLITGVVPATAGEVHFDGRSLSGLSPYRICQSGL